MAVRLQMKLGVVAEQDRLPDSPDTSSWSSRGSAPWRVRRATCTCSSPRRSVATGRTKRRGWPPRRSATSTTTTSRPGIRVCLEKAISLANKRLAHQRDRLGLGHAEDGAGPIGVGVAVVRGNELYVATVGPAEAYLIRQARLSTLPDPHRDRGLPTGELEPDVWRGELSVGDSLVLVSPNLVAKLGTDELKDAMVTLHPQSAMEHLHHRFVAAGGSGSDGAIAFEATEVASTHKQRTLVPVRPAEPLAGAPDRWPDPAGRQRGRRRRGDAGRRAARLATAAGNGLRASVWRIQDLLPRRKPGYRRVTPLCLAARDPAPRGGRAARLRRRRRRARDGRLVLRRPGSDRRGRSARSTAGQRALDRGPGRSSAQVWGDGVDLVERRSRRRARELPDGGLRGARGRRRTAGVPRSRPSARSAPGRGRPRPDLRRRDGRGDGVAFAFEAKRSAGRPAALVLGPGRGGRTSSTGRPRPSIRIDLKANKAASVFIAGKAAGGATPRTAIHRPRRAGPPDPRLGQRPVALAPAERGKGTLARCASAARRAGATTSERSGRSCGTPSAASTTSTWSIPPSSRSCAYTPARDGSGFPRPRHRPACRPRAPVAEVTDLYIDGDIFIAEAGAIVRRHPGDATGRLTRPGRRAAAEAAPVSGRSPRPRSGAPARSTPSTPPTTGSSPSTRTAGDYMRAVPARRRQHRLGGPPRHVRRSRAIEDQPGTLWWIDGSSVRDVGPRRRSRTSPAAITRRPRPLRRLRPSPLVVIPLRDANPTRRPPVVTLALIVACSAVFA